MPVLALAGCTLTPVYSEANTEGKFAVRFAPPADRLQQLVYQDLALRFPGTAGPDAPTVHITVRPRAHLLARTATDNPLQSLEVGVTGTIKIIAADGKTVLPSTSRTASAGYEVSGQVFADTEARTEATERATHELAESLRLAMLAALASR
ncbi:MAG TPA: hypothetical protein VGM83_02450 [Devosiaceae bacterium]